MPRQGRAKPSSTTRAPPAKGTTTGRGRGRPKKQGKGVLAGDSQASSQPVGATETAETPDPIVDQPVLEEEDPYFQNQQVDSDDHTDEPCGAPSGLIVKDIPFPQAQAPILLSAVPQPNQVNTEPISIAKRKTPLSPAAPSKATKLPRTDAQLVSLFERHEATHAGAAASVANANPVENSTSLALPMNASPPGNELLPPIDPTLLSSSVGQTPNALQQSSRSISLPPGPPPQSTDSTVTAEPSETTAPGLRSPHWMSEKKILGTASPNTKGVLGVASSLYKAKLLLDNPFPEAGNLRPLFLNEVWKEAHKLVPPRDGSTLKLTSDVEIVIHSLGTTFRGAHGSSLISLATGAYGIPFPLTNISRNMVNGLLEDANFIFPKVYFNSDGSVMRSVDDPDVILREDPPFGHPFIQSVINYIIFTGRPPMGISYPDQFNPIPLPTLAYAATLAHFALMNVANDLRTNFCAEHYASRFEEYLERAKEFQDDEPLECNKIRVDLWTSGRGKIRLNESKPRSRTSTKGLSKTALAAQLAKLCPTGSPQLIPPSASASTSSSAGPVSAATAQASANVNGSVGHNAHPQYLMPYQMQYGYPGPRGYVPVPGAISPPYEWNGPPGPPA